MAFATAMTLIQCALGALAAVSLVVGWRRWRGDATPRCPGCRYEMTGINAGVCPECGRASRSSRALFRHRRKRRRRATVVAALLVAMALGAPSIDAARRGAWPRLIPTLVLARIAWFAPGYSLRAGPASKPPTPRNVEMALSKELRRRERLPSTSPREAALIGRRAIEEARLRGFIALPGWASGERAPPVRVMAWWFLAPCRLTIERADGVALWSLQAGGLGSSDHDPLFLDHPISGSQFIAASERLIARWEVRASGGWTPVLTEDLHLRYAPRMDDVVIPVRDPALDAMIRDRFVFLRLPIARGELPLMQVGLPPDAPPDITWGFVIEVRANDGAIVSTAHVCLRAGRERDPELPNRLLYFDRALPGSNAGEPDLRTIVIRSSAEMAALDLGAIKRWDGEVTIPFARLTHRERATAVRE